MGFFEQNKANRVTGRGSLSDALRIVRYPRKSLQFFSSVSLYRNAFYLVLNNVAVQVTGFFFWMVAAHLYSADAVGLASAANNMMTFLASMAGLGLDYAIVRFLPGAGKNSKDMINTGLTLQFLASIVVTGIFLAGLSFWSPALLPIRQNPVFLSIFVISVVASTTYIFTQRVFVAWRRSGLALTRGLVFSISRFIPLIALAFFMPSFGIFTAWGIAIVVAVFVSMLSIYRTEKGYSLVPTINKGILKNMVTYSLANYITNIFTFSNAFIFPIMVINLLGAEQNAYFYIGWAIGSILFIIPIAISMSLMAEGSHDPDKLKPTVRRSLKLMTLALIPAIVLMLLVGDKLLLLFGEMYSENAARLLQLLALSAFPFGINIIYFNMKRVEHQIRKVATFSLLIAVMSLGLSYILLPRIGIEGVGVAWLASQVVAASLIGYLNRSLYYRNHLPDSS